MLNRVIQKYYIKQLIEIIKEQIKLYYLDYKIVEKKDNICLLVKKRKYNDNEFRHILSFNKKFILSHIANFDDTTKLIRECVENYEKSER